MTRGRLLALWCLLVVVDVAVQPGRGLGTADRTDWVAFATGGRMIHDGAGADLYSLHAQAAAQVGVLGHPLDIGLNVYSNPPAAAWLIAPLATLPLRTGLALFMALSVMGLAVAVAALAGLVPGRPATERVGLALATGVLLATADGVAYGQWDPVVLAAVAVAVRLLAGRGDGVLAGVLLGLAAVKPQLAWLVLPLLLVAGLRRTAAGFLATLCAWAATTLLLVGPDGIRRWLQDVLPAVDRAFGAAGLPGIVEDAGGGTATGLVAAAVSAVVALALCARARSRLRREAPLTAALGVTLSALCAPHAYDRDLALAGVLLAVLAARRPGAACALAVVAGLAFLVDDRIGSGPFAHLLMVVVVAAVVLALRAPSAVRDGVPRGTAEPEVTPVVHGAQVPGA